MGSGGWEPISTAPQDGTLVLLGWTYDLSGGANGLPGSWRNGRWSLDEEPWFPIGIPDVWRPLGDVR